MLRTARIWQTRKNLTEVPVSNSATNGEKQELTLAAKHAMPRLVAANSVGKYPGWAMHRVTSVDVSPALAMKINTCIRRPG